MSSNNNNEGSPLVGRSGEDLNMLQITHNEQVTREGKKLYRQFVNTDPYISYFKQPHTVTMLVLTGAVLIYVAFTRDVTESFESNTKVGLIAVALCYLLFSALQMKDGLFVRPHPIFWRLVMGLGVLYSVILIFLLFHSADDARWILKKVDSRIGDPLPERSYADNCTLYTPDDPDSNFKYLMATLNDEFMLAHFLGWFGKAILLRDWWLCWIMSILFELLEISLKHLLPNFAECWWDHIILDILLMNFLGFSFGLKVCEWLSIKPYSWVSKNISSLDQYNWEVLRSYRRLAGAVTLVLTVNLIELNAFFLKYVLYIPPPHPINIIRLVLWWSMGLPGVREFYQFVTDPNCKRFGTMAWLCAAVASLELLVWLKFGRGMFPEPTPPTVYYSWGTAIVLFNLWALWWYGYKNKQNKKAPVTATYIEKKTK